MSEPASFLRQFYETLCAFALLASRGLGLIMAIVGAVTIVDSALVGEFYLSTVLLTLAGLALFLAGNLERIARSNSADKSHPIMRGYARHYRFPVVLFYAVQAVFVAAIAFGAPHGKWAVLIFASGVVVTAAVTVAWKRFRMTPRRAASDPGEGTGDRG